MTTKLKMDSNNSNSSKNLKYYIIFGIVGMILISALAYSIISQDKGPNNIQITNAYISGEYNFASVDVINLSNEQSSVNIDVLTTNEDIVCTSKEMILNKAGIIVTWSYPFIIFWLPSVSYDQDTSFMSCNIESGNTYLVKAVGTFDDEIITRTWTKIAL